MTKRGWIVLLVWVVSIVGVACGGSDDNADGPLTVNEFSPLCAGEAQPRAAAYTPDTGPNQIMLLTDSTIGDQYDYYSIRFTDELPDEWFPQIVDGTFDYSPVELVVCIHRSATAVAETCAFEDDYMLTVHDATYEVRVLAAQTGEQLAMETVQADGECPGMHMFDSKEESYYADISEAQLQPILEAFAP